MAIAHGSHPVGNAELAKRAKRPPPSQRVGAASHEALPRQQTLQCLWSPTQNSFCVYIVCWLMNDGK
ncbi:hypothetical protein JG688_00012070 [Phytophthora aleatoria]|uniref:Uncharacterized protein n=1 Tax=Phytophthora aleatoria TaxID=2496075 RepID=A0A8J5IRM6_9STRA|nr:hypothetical protein JG688_00012070 [Phytophthora aleatoria]